MIKSLYPNLYILTVISEEDLNLVLSVLINYNSYLYLLQDTYLQCLLFFEIFVIYHLIFRRDVRR